MLLWLAECRAHPTDKNRQAQNSDIQEDIMVLLGGTRTIRYSLLSILRAGFGPRIHGW